MEEEDEEEGAMGANESRSEARANELRSEAPKPRTEEPKKQACNNCQNTLQRTGSAKLPHNYEAIMKDADSPIPSTEKVYDHLYSGVFLSQKRKMYWVEKNSGHNCFMLFPRDLSITWGGDKRYWHWPYMPETKSNVLVEVAELLNVCWLEVRGKFNTSNLSPGILYEVVFLVMLKDPATGWENQVNFGLVLPDGEKKEHKELLQNKPRGQWVEIPVGEFRPFPEKVGEMQIFITEYDSGHWKRGLVVKSVIIRPKN